MKQEPKPGRGYFLLAAILWSGFLYLHISAPRAVGATCLEAPPNLVDWWRGEGNANDELGVLNGTLVNGTGFAPGEVGQAFNFDGRQNMVTNAVGGLIRITNSYTFEFWAWPTASRASTTETTSGIAGISNQRYAIFPHYGLASVVGAGVSVGTNGVSVFEHGNVYLPSLLVYDAPIAGWTHIAVVYNNKQPSLYLNGVLVKTGLTSINPSFPGTNLGEEGYGYGYYAGLLDEVSIYSRALTGTEIQAILNAGSSGKCPAPFPPTIYAQPTNQSVFVGQNVTLTVGASGSPPLSYLWSVDGNAIAGGTNSSLVLTNVQMVQAGNYSVQVTNTAGSVTSSNALVTVNPPPACAPVPSGLISWWQGEGNPNDDAGLNNGVLEGGVTFGPGLVGQGFIFNGNGSYVQIPNSPSVNLTNAFTIELWYKYTGSSSSAYGLIAKRATYPQPCNFAIEVNPAIGGNLNVYLRDTNYASYQTSSTPAPSAGTFHHVAATFQQATATQVAVNTYVDGQLVQIAALSGNLARTLNNAPVTIGASDASDFFFGGIIDEPTIYSRVLSTAEIQTIYNAGISGKCPAVFPAIISSQPANLTVVVGQNASFSVLAGGTPPLRYQWGFQGTAIAGATNSSLTLTNVQSVQAGSYNVVVTNATGSITSSNALLTVNPAPPCAGPAPGLVSWWQGEGDAIDIFGANNGIISNGITFVPGMVGNAFNFDGTTGAIVIPPAINLAVQSLTIEAWINPTDVSIPRPIVEYGAPGEYTDVSFWYSFNPGGAGVPGALYALVRDANPSIYMDLGSAGGLVVPNQWSHVAFTFDPVAKVAELFVNGAPVATNNFAPMLQPHTYTEVNLGLRPVGSVDVWGGRRHAGGMDEVSIYARALSSQEIRAIYNAGLIGKCQHPVAPMIDIQPANQTVTVGQRLTLGVGASGTQPVSYQWTLNGSAIPGASTPSLTFTNAQSSQAGTYAVVITNAAGSITSSNAVLTVILPSLTATLSQPNINLSWPLWATNFTLQQADGTQWPSLIWSNVPAAFTVTNNSAFVTLPITGTTRFYRLKQ